jgi:peptide/nickel transport system permease protein
VSADLSTSPGSGPPAAPSAAGGDAWTPRGWLRRRRGGGLSAAASLVFLALLAAATLASPRLGLPDPNATDLTRAMLTPSWLSGAGRHAVLGTDPLGRDVLSRLVYGGRISLLVGFATALIAGVLGIAAGLLSGYYGGLLDTLLMSLADVQLGVPVILLMLGVIAVVGPGLWNLIAVLGITGWVLFARITRSEVLALRATAFVEVARSTGATHARVLWKHVLPNVVQSSIVLATFTVPQMILTEAALSFLGLGVQPPTATWGSMIADGRRYLLVGVWWPTFFPGAMLFGTVMSINLVGDWLRLRLDPRSR